MSWSLVIALALNHVPVLPRRCVWCERNVTSISQRRYRSALEDGWVTCKCGTPLGPLKELVL